VQEKPVLGKARAGKAEARKGSGGKIRKNQVTGKAGARGQVSRRIRACFPCHLLFLRPAFPSTCFSCHLAFPAFPASVQLFL